MYPRLLNVYGPLWIQSYGTMIALGFFLFLVAAYHHPLRKKIVSSDDYFSLFFTGLLVGIIGGRLGFIINKIDYFIKNWDEIFSFWAGGFTSQGTILSVAIIIPACLYFKKIPLLSFLDLAAIHAPLLQSLGRLGCLFAGCCYGCPAEQTAFFKVTFTDPQGFGPLFVPLVPVAAYVSMASLGLFIVLYALSRIFTIKPGFLSFFYLFAESSLRFISDFWRDDRENLVIINNFFSSFSMSKHIIVSQSQITALVIMGISLLALLVLACYYWCINKQNCCTVSNNPRHPRNLV